MTALGLATQTDGNPLGEALARAMSGERRSSPSERLAERRRMLLRSDARREQVWG